MTHAVADTDVVNAALRLVGSSRITSLTADDIPAVVASDLYDEVVDDLLRQHAWNFATKRQKLAQLTDTPVFEFDHAYSFPADWLRTVSVHSNEDATQRVFYRAELVSNQRVIVTSADEIWMRYVAKIKDPNLWSADFRRAVITTLARDLAIPLANSNKLLELLEIRSKQDLARARPTDAMGSSPERRPRGSWVTRRGASLPVVATTVDE